MAVSLENPRMYQCSRVFAFIDFSLQIFKGGLIRFILVFLRVLYHYLVYIALEN